MKPLINGTQFALPGYVRARIDGRLVYDFNGQERCAWVGGADNPDRATWRQDFDRESLTEYGESQTARVLILNVEHYTFGQLGKLAVMLEVLRASNPGMRVGLWSILPVSNYFILANWAGWRDFKAGRPHNDLPASWWSQIQNGPTFEAAYRGWQAENAIRAKILGPHIDFTCPSIYPVVEPPADKVWMGAIEPELMIAEAKRQCPGKPCYPSWSPHFPGTDKLVSKPYAETVLRTAFDRADGVTLWTDSHVTRELATDTLAMMKLFQPTSQE